MRLTDTQKRELSWLYHVYRKTVGSYHWRDGMSLRLKTGKSLAKLGLVEVANRYSANRFTSWRLTETGKKLCEELFPDVVEAVPHQPCDICGTPHSEKVRRTGTAEDGKHLAICEVCYQRHYELDDDFINRWVKHDGKRFYF